MSSKLCLETTHYLVQDLQIKHEPQLQKIVAHPGFFYPYIQGNPQAPGSNIKENVRYYAAKAEEYSKQQRARKTYLMGIFTKNTNDLIGVTALVDVQDAPLFVGANPKTDREIGFFVAVPHQRHGVAFEASEALVDWAMTAIGLKNLWASVDPDNAASIATLKKLDLEKVGETPTSKFTDQAGNIRPRDIYKTLNPLA